MAEQKRQVKIKITDDVLMGRYANFMRVAHTGEEFILEFANIVAPVGSVVAKVFTSPRHLKRIIRALQENLKKYEDEHGEVQEAEEPKREIGF